jgi:cytochrome c-type biogenesis protein CcmH
MGHLIRPCLSSDATGRRSLCPSALAGVLISVILSLLVLAAGGAAAKSWSYDLAGDLMSPYCPGRTLSSCPSPQAAELVQWMVVQESGGATKEQVIEMLVERFGEEILGAPPAKGITIWAYVLPILGFVLGGGFVGVALRRIVARGSPREVASEHGNESQAGGVDADLAKLVDAELDDLAAGS